MVGSESFLDDCGACSNFLLISVSSLKSQKWECNTSINNNAIELNLNNSLIKKEKA